MAPWEALSLPLLLESRRTAPRPRPRRPRRRVRGAMLDVLLFLFLCRILGRTRRGQVDALWGSHGVFALLNGANRRRRRLTGRAAWNDCSGQDRLDDEHLGICDRHEMR